MGVTPPATSLGVSIDTLVCTGLNNLSRYNTYAHVDNVTPAPSPIAHPCPSQGKFLPYPLFPTTLGTRGIIHAMAIAERVSERIIFIQRSLLRSHAEVGRSWIWITVRRRRSVLSILIMCLLV